VDRRRHASLDRSEVLSAVTALQEFKAWLRREVAFETFTTADDLGRKIATALANVAAAPSKPTGRTATPTLPPLAFEALGEREHAQRAFTQALTVRERITHPQVAATREALARVR
jgi:hypothetical protein